MRKNYKITRFSVKRSSITLDKPYKNIKRTAIDKNE